MCADSSDVPIQRTGVGTDPAAIFLRSPLESKMVEVAQILSEGSWHLTI